MMKVKQVKEVVDLLSLEEGLKIKKRKKVAVNK